MNRITVAPYGSWKSPIAADRVAAKSIQLAEVAADGPDVYWIELRPAEGGRNVIVQRRPDGTTLDRTPKGFNARTRVHEYGGGAYVVADGVIWFSNDSDQRIYRQAGEAAPIAITPALSYRFADAVYDRARNRLIAVREDHTRAGEAVNTIVAIRADGDLNGGTLLVSGNDFYAAPRLSPDGEYLAWLTWNHPNLPWDGCELWVAHVDKAGTLDEAVKVAGGPTESICQPEWSPDGVLHFVSDRTDWWNLYRWRAGQVEALCPMAAEFGQPAWQFRFSNYGFADGGPIVCAYTQDGLGRIGLLEPGAGGLKPVESPFSIFGSLRISGARALMLAGSATAPTAVTALDLATLAWTSISEALASEIDAAYFSVPQAISFPTTGGAIAHALYYPPASPDFAAPEGDRPPLIVRSHGGPTSAATAAFGMGVQYVTSRGFAFVDVNYGGSSGYGRAYRERLKGQWGVVDVDDCINAARYLVDKGLADEDKVAIEGGSAGGYTTLAALAFRDYFKAGASLFGLSELEIFAKETHKYESRYLDGLIGPYPAQRDLYIERSPLFKARNISVPVIFFQGDEDKIVPPNQAELMFDAVRAREIPTAYVLFKGEQHGFRKAENIQRTLEGRLYFYAKVFGIPLVDDIPPLEIENL
ncbi:MAG: S9 family peptidase [Anaerolineae bacterium]|nr:S9 family peptidase [Anaerolineae bacterium]